MKKCIIILFFLGLIPFQTLLGQITRKAYTMRRTLEAPKIDGKPFESIWEKAQAGDEFVMLQPENGQTENNKKKSIIKILYDDKAVYVAGFLYDDNPEEIDRQFSQRDQVNVQADLFSFWINTYNNQIDQTRFYVTSSGAIADSKATNGQEDFSYDVVFNAKSSIDENGWYVEIEIPYQALRFPKTAVQDWTFNAFRKINSLNETYTYNLIDITQGNEAQYDAVLKGVENINPPFRLSLFPYVSAQSVTFDGTSQTDYNAGLDLKYGINDAFTLDLTLIPDFGQVAFDEVVLNLSPFEQTFQERRPFFTEGTELLSKGNLFFSRRIGQQPIGFNNVSNELLENEVVSENPELSQLVNALKVTGRTKSKLGVGILNAITSETKSVINDTISGVQREFVTDPLTNYNIVVLDQQYGNNSSIYLTNANTFRSGSFTDANVSAIGVEHFDKKNIYRYKADIKMSNRFRESETEQGLFFEGRWERIQGKWRYGVTHRNFGQNYNPNDLGLLFRNNRNATYLFGSFNQFKPKGIFNNYRFNFEVGHIRANVPDLHSYSEAFFLFNFQTKKFLNGGFFSTIYTRELDFFESRIQFLPVLYNPRMIFGTFLTTDTRKKFSLGANVNVERRFDDPEFRFEFSLRPSFRFGDKLFMRYSFFWQRRNNRLSFVTLDNNTSILSLRDTYTIENSIEGVYNFDTTKAINLRFRNFWSSASFSPEYRSLLADGQTERYQGNSNFNPDADFNVWNMDLSFDWRFAPASNLTILYRNNFSNFQNDGDISFKNSINQLFSEPIEQTFSVRLTYFLDVNRLIAK